MRELTDRELEAVAGGGSSLAGATAVGGASALLAGLAYQSSSTQSSTTLASATSSASNHGLAFGVSPVVVSGASSSASTVA